MVFLDFLCYAFAAVVFIQVIYFFILGRFAFLKQKKGIVNNLPVSVIICAKNQAENLEKFLPSIISQKYNDFEIVLINDASHDETLDVMEAFSLQHANIKIVDVKSNEAFWGIKKYALTLGIKAAKHNHLLFTNANCKPVSKHWITRMCSHFNEEKTVILGYRTYLKNKKSFLNKIIRFENLITAVQYFSFAKVSMPYMGVGDNLAYTKTEFFKANGFINHIKVRSGDDDLFINQVANKTNTEMCFSTDSFIESIPETTFKNWFKQKKNHIRTAKYYKKTHKFILATIRITNLLFWFLAIILLVLQYNWQIILPLFLFRIIAQYIMIGFSAKKLNEKDLIIFLPFLEIFLMITQLTIFINNFTSKPEHWK